MVNFVAAATPSAVPDAGEGAPVCADAYPVSPMLRANAAAIKTIGRLVIGASPRLKRSNRCALVWQESIGESPERFIE